MKSDIETQLNLHKVITVFFTHILTFFVFVKNIMAII